MDIQTYNQKRDFTKTDEPKGKLSSAQGNIFCVQEHFASHHHFDFRLELDGALKSWAVPKGPSLSPSDKRLAVHVEDHPVDYADFEGQIPKGEYGAGEVILWDQGSWRPLKDPREGLEKGRLEFEINGEKLQGKWALIRMKGKDSKNWLLIKMKDEYASDEDILKERPGSVKKKDIKLFEPQLAMTYETPPEGDDFLREIKHDGYRTLVSVQKGRAKIYSRNKKDWTSKLNFIAEELKDSGLDDIVLDGETVMLGADGVSSFAELQRAFNSSKTDALRFYAFDVLYLNGKDLRPLPQKERKDILKREFSKIKGDRVLYSEHFEESGELFFEKMREFGLEGMMSKRADAPYQAGRNENWIKTKCLKTEPFVVIGFYYQKENSSKLGSLLVARKNEKGSIEVGKAGSGLSHKERRELLKSLEPNGRPPKDIEIPENYLKDVTFCEPKVVLQIRFNEVTPSGALRHPVIEGEREDLAPGSVLNWLSNKEKISKNVTSLERELWPGVTKKDYANYLLKYEDKLGPGLYGRPLTLFKCPKGIMENSCFFSKHKANMAGLKEITIPVGDKEKEFYEVVDEKGLLHIARYSGVEFHVWNSTSKDPWTAQEMVLDLDPGENVREQDLIAASLKIRKMLEALKLKSFPKSTGKKGLHIHVPLLPKYSVDQIYQLSKSIAFILEEEAPKEFTSSPKIKDRSDKIFLDYMRNSFGATFVAPYSPRANKDAAIALPLQWEDLENKKSLPRTTLKEALDKEIPSAWTDYWSSAQEVDLFERD